MRILITGGAGFIGTALCRHLLGNNTCEVIVLDKLTYASNMSAVEELSAERRYTFVKADICDPVAVGKVFQNYKPDALVHLAAESHVDRSIVNAQTFVRTNIEGTLCLLEATRSYLSGLDRRGRSQFRFLHVSTDEVFGDLEGDGIFNETTRYNPSSPYAASKAASDHLVRAFIRTYGLPAIVSNCTNNYGPEQFPEKLIPLMCHQAMNGMPMPVYGNGSQIRDWLHVRDHARALVALLERGQPGSTYAIGARNECRNIDLVRKICSLFDRLRPENAPHDELISYVADRPGHDQRYAVDPTRIETEIGWRPEVSFEQGLTETIRWYLSNSNWQHPASAASRSHEGQQKVPA
ncbi:MAG: dTDP-glucose 4,6-dehydratase [Roseibium sp.]|uniref:dTDP-glucose 4,6-dehydratase n=1 Tax=Roseibium sp. TaxID=1936156 RepID=UPI00260E8E42|nr:dTDP-glucose 4,6-dehydratase [Roseibium sp.]MCV0425418.1 dTDP-glucose 4,6-dehydratase [Roseibium sp.]